jgi:CheY-like chemotaxis protein
VAHKIAILEDNADRQAVMRRCLADRFYTFDAHFFADSGEMIRFLERHLPETLVVALDNDLDLIPAGDGRLTDPGSGVDVAAFLAARPPVCPVVIHTTNTHAAETMTATLHGAGWRTRRVIPFDDMAWIETDWVFAVRRSLVGPISRQGRETRPNASH